MVNTERVWRPILEAAIFEGCLNLWVDHFYNGGPPIPPELIQARYVQVGICHISIFGPSRSETNRVLLFPTRDLLPELKLFLEHFLDHF